MPVRFWHASRASELAKRVVEQLEAGWCSIGGHNLAGLPAACRFLHNPTAIPTRFISYHRPAGGAFDHGRSGTYIQLMNDGSDKSFGDELERLAKRLDDLVVTCNQLKEENRSLRQRQDALTAERANLLQKNEQVRARVEAMIGRLKAMEHGA
jgi:cell division protein ZapB